MRLARTGARLLHRISELPSKLILGMIKMMYRTMMTIVTTEVSKP